MSAEQPPAGHEIAAELLKRREVHDANGEPIGRIADICVVGVPGALVVEYYWVAPASAATRLAAENLGWHLLQLVGIGRDNKGYRVGWEDMDLSDPTHPRARRAKSELERM
jgi:hypothetical protein